MSQINNSEAETKLSSTPRVPDLEEYLRSESEKTVSGNQILLGTNVDTKQPVYLDLQKLLETRLLVQANSGGGKSWTLRYLMEQTFGKLQHIIFTVSGEYNTLREKYPYLLIGKRGDIPLDINNMETLVRKLLKLKTSVIIDLSEFSHDDKVHYVKLFLEALVAVPESFWHPAMIILDETQVFCPQVGACESRTPVVDLMEQGRKMGFVGVLGTQRLANIHKNAAAEASNVMIGRTGLDNDQKRAGSSLGFNAKRSVSLRELEPGDFYVYGPAISNQVIKVHIGQVQTTHKSGGVLRSSVTPASVNETISQLKKIESTPSPVVQTRSTQRRTVEAPPKVKQPRRSQSKEEPIFHMKPSAVFTGMLVLGIILFLSSIGGFYWSYMTSLHFSTLAVGVMVVSLILIAVGSYGHSPSSRIFRGTVECFYV